MMKKMRAIIAVGLFLAIILAVVAIWSSKSQPVPLPIIDGASVKSATKTIEMDAPVVTFNDEVKSLSASPSSSSITQP